MPVSSIYDIAVRTNGVAIPSRPMNGRVDWEGRTYDILIQSMTQDAERDPNGVNRLRVRVRGAVAREGHLATGEFGRGRMMIEHPGYTDILNVVQMNWSLDHGVQMLEVMALHLERLTDAALDDQGNVVPVLTQDEMALRRPGESNAEMRQRGDQALREIREELRGIRAGAAREPNLREVWAD